MPTDPKALAERLMLRVLWNATTRRYEVEMTLTAPGLWLNKRTAASVRRAIERYLPVVSKGGCYGV